MSILYPAFTRDPITIDTTEAGDEAGVDIVVDEDAPAPITGFIYNAGKQLTKDEFAAQLTATGAGRLQITPSKGKYCGTGTKVELIDEETDEVLEIYYLIVCGDVNGDAIGGTADISLTNKFIDGTNTNWYIKDTVADAEAKRICAELAADVNGDGKVDSEDVNYMELVTAQLAEYSYNTESHL